MAINLGVSHAKFPYRIKYYDHAYVDDDTKLIEGETVKGLFYARKHTSVVTISYVTQAGIKLQKKEISLYTEDKIKNLEVDDFIIFEKEKWLVQSIDEAPISDTKDKSNFSGYIIKLRA